MKYAHWICFGFLLTVVDVDSAVAQPQECAGATIIYTGPHKGAWQSPLNWDQVRPTLPTDEVCIPLKTEVRVTQGVCTDPVNAGLACDPESGNSPCPGPGDCVPVSPTADAGNLLLTGTAGQYQLRVGAGTTLTIHGRRVCSGTTTPCTADPDCNPGTCDEVPSHIDGTLYLNLLSTLTIAGHVTFRGSGGILEGEFQTPFGETLPVLNGPGRLTIIGDQPSFTCVGGPDQGNPCNVNLNCRQRGTCNASGFCQDGNENPLVGCDCPSGVCSGHLLLTESWHIDVEFINEATVDATHTNPITLSGAPKSGSGAWIVSHEPTAGTEGVLVIACQFGGDGPLITKNANAIIRIGTAASFTAYVGDVTLAAGSLLEINQDFSTTGNLDMQGGTIAVAAGKTASFD